MSGTLNSNPRQYNMLDRFWKILRRHRSNPTATTTASTATSQQPQSAAVEA